jgi:hypothetical protein
LTILDNVLTVSESAEDYEGLTLTQETSKKEWERGMRNLTAADFVDAFWQW